MLQLDLLRHGQSVRNLALEQCMQDDHELCPALLNEEDEGGWLLTPDGETQALRAGSWIRQHGQEYAAKYCSPLLRASHTAELLGLEGEWQWDMRLRERCWGNYSKMPGFTCRDYLALQSHYELYWEPPAPGGESMADIYFPTVSLLSSLMDRYSTGKLLLVTHGGRIKSMQLLLERFGLPGYAQLPNRPIPNCGMLQYRLHDVDSASGCWGRTEVRLVDTRSDGPEPAWEECEQPVVSLGLSLSLA